jgi:hypothetical protein
MVGADNMSGNDVDVDVKFTVPKGQGFGDNANAGSMAGMDMSPQTVTNSGAPSYLPWIFALGGMAFGGMLTWVLAAGRRKTVVSEPAVQDVSV